MGLGVVVMLLFAIISVVEPCGNIAKICTCIHVGSMSNARLRSRYMLCDDVVIDHTLSSSDLLQQSTVPKYAF